MLNWRSHTCLTLLQCDLPNKTYYLVYTLANTRGTFEQDLRNLHEHFRSPFFFMGFVLICFFVVFCILFYIFYLSAWSPEIKEITLSQRNIHFPHLNIYLQEYAIENGGLSLLCFS